MLRNATNYGCRDGEHDLVYLCARFAFRAKTRSLSVTGEAESAAATRASDADDPSARLLVAEDEA